MSPEHERGAPGTSFAGLAGAPVLDAVRTL